MNRKNLPLILMLTAGAVTCIITFIRRYTMVEKLASLLVVLALFYLLGCIWKWTLDYFDSQNEKRRQEEGEVIEKENAADVENSEAQVNRADSGEEKA